MNANITEALVQQLITTQFPQWQDLPIRQVLPGGWDNRTFRLGNTMLVRLPSGRDYAAKVAIEQAWLPKLAPHLPVPIPTPIAMGEPNAEYPWPWSIYAWIPGHAAADVVIPDLSVFAADLGHFLLALHRIPTTRAPQPGDHNFYRGGSLRVYDAETRQALLVLQDKIDVQAAQSLWDQALANPWTAEPVWVHGDISPGNLLVQNTRLCGVIDFGGMAVGDPACDLAIAWTFFHGQSRNIFQKALNLDTDTWQCAKAWALWKALIVAAELTDTNVGEKRQCWNTLNALSVS